MSTRAGAAIAAAAFGVLGTVVIARPSQAPQQTFKAGVDLIAVDVQVLDKTGKPVPALAVDKFDVTIDGKKRRVVSADFFNATTSVPVTPARAEENPLEAATSRLVMLAVDADSFQPGVSRGVITAASSFVKRLLPSDRIGLYTYPLGPRVDPTNDRGEVLAALDKVVGQKAGGDTGQFSLGPSDIVDLSAWVSGASPHPVSGDGDALAARICGGERPDRPRDDQCIKNLQFEAESLSRFYEAEGTQRSGMVSNLIQGLSSAPGRKIIVLVSGGMVASDRPSLRPDLADIGVEVGRQAAEANVTVYTLFIDQTWLDTYSPQRRKPPPRPPDAERDRAVLSKWLEQFSGSAGGALMRVMSGSGEAAFDRIVSETSAYYILGVEPTGVDRDGKTHQINVKVSEKGLTVRGRSFVKLPKRAGGH